MPICYISRHFSTSGWKKSHPVMHSQSQSDIKLVTVVSKIYRLIVTNFNVNFKTASGSETDTVDDDTW